MAEESMMIVLCWDSGVDGWMMKIEKPSHARKQKAQGQIKGCESESSSIHGTVKGLHWNSLCHKRCHRWDFGMDVPEWKGEQDLWTAQQVLRLGRLTVGKSIACAVGKENKAPIAREREKGSKAVKGLARTVKWGAKTRRKATMLWTRSRTPFHFPRAPPCPFHRANMDVYSEKNY